MFHLDQGLREEVVKGQSVRFGLRLFSKIPQFKSMLKFINLKIRYLNEFFWGEKGDLRTQNDVFFWDYKPKGMKNDKGREGGHKIGKMGGHRL